MKPPLLIYLSIITVAIITGVAISQSPAVKVGLYAHDDLSSDSITQLAATVFNSNNIEILTFYSLADVENAPKVNLFIASLYPTLVYNREQKNSVILESKEASTTKLITSRRSKIRKPEDLKGKVIGVGSPDDGDPSFLLAVFNLRPFADIRRIPSRLRNEGIPNLFSFKILDRKDRRVQASQGNIDAYFEEDKNDNNDERTLLAAKAPKLYVSTNLSNEDNEHLKDLLINYEPEFSNATPTTSEERLEAQRVLAELGYSFNESTQYATLNERYQEFFEDLPY